ncbi:MAG: AbrB/MazE/SpoVT family DNA-binding domain-containing protein [Thermoplasmatota archaeon]
MAELTLTPKRIGGSVHVIIPADIARREGIREGVPVRITIEKSRPKALGLLKDVLHGQHFDRAEEALYPTDV